ncbi:MAG: SDR family NAD(P)-dependent oxidoreductase, partial [Clostridia bacterium]|nr:SDR family NAD(P)-dependent oxidoreductase [Clostridia bacterium]
MKKALVTGASSGLGREFARLLAPHCEEIVIVGRNEKRLAALCEELSAVSEVKVV